MEAFSLEVEDRRSRDLLIGVLADGRRVSFDELLGKLKGEELKEMCSALGLPATGTKAALVTKLLGGVPDARTRRARHGSAAEQLPLGAPAAPPAQPVHAAPAEPEPPEEVDEPAPTSIRFPRGTAPTTRSVLSVLSKPRVAEVARELGVSVQATATREQQVDAILSATHVAFDYLMRSLGRDELRSACRAHGLDDSGRARPLLAARLLQAHGAQGSQPPPPIFRAHEIPRYAPRPGDIVEVRHRQWLAEEVVAPPELGHTTRVRLVCLDDDNQGRVLEVLWELELGARVLQPEAHGLGETTKVDEPRFFAAYLHALKWGSVTATDAKLFQSPFRAGITLLNHQLTPLKKALSLPRANLFIADDVGLGKTIEAGLVLQELLLRQRVEFALVVCPASVCLQWRDEMQRKFGLYFEIMNRSFISRRRQERGFGVNPWSTHTRFIVSHQLMRRPEYRDPLLQHIGDRRKKSILILDEAHVAAPASASQYAVDSHITAVIRDLAPKFENRLFLSATPHNGHSNSFSALLEILDPQRFTRAVRVRPADLEPVMVRRLKSDLIGDIGPKRKGDAPGPARASLVYPVRRVIRLEVPENDSRPPELEIAEKLAAYTALMKPKRGRGKLVFINLQKRLLSSVEAFARTLRVHGETMRGSGAFSQVGLAEAARRQAEDDEYGEDDDVLDQEEAAEVGAASRLLEHPEAQAQRLLEELTTLAERYRHVADAKVSRLVQWIREHQCPAVAIGGATGRGAWNDRRVIIFTEYGDTKRYLLQVLGTAVEGTSKGDERILQIHGGMSDEQREEVQRAFNSPPEEHPVRILLATDAAREGINLQGHCADLFHFDIPWNPARLEQRNGRIDRTMQPEPEVRCHYFHYPARAEDLVLDKLVHKVDVIKRELGSLSQVLLERMERVLEDGIDTETASRIDDAEQAGGRAERVREELEAIRKGALERDATENGNILQSSTEVMGFKPWLLRDAIDAGLELAGAPALQKTDTEGVFQIPELSTSWQSTLDTLRPPRGRDEAFWDWRKKPPQPVLFEPPLKMNSRNVHLHLEHPFVQRILARFLAQGYSAHDLSRVTIVRNKHDHIVRVVAFGRLSLFGHGATRLHDELISVAAQWVQEKDQPLRPFAEAADRGAIDKLEQVLAESPTLAGISEANQRRIAAAAPNLFRQLWHHVREEADAHAKDALDALRRRGREEAAALEAILERQLAAIDAELQSRTQLGLFEAPDPREVRQYELDTQYLKKRRESLEVEKTTEPKTLEAFYDVVRTRLEPVGLVCLWPATRG
ncbi:MAG: hypothetical protein JNL21_19405 [Myxococcales bacterium]|nr:hypothetical protein [Myxococcales bacterium]